MRIEQITRYISDDGYSFELESHAMARDCAVAIQKNWQLVENAFVTLQKNCSHDLVTMSAGNGMWSDHYSIECLLCMRQWLEPHETPEWKDRWNTKVGVVALT